MVVEEKRENTMVLGTMIGDLCGSFHSSILRHRVRCTSNTLVGKNGLTRGVAATSRGRRATRAKRERATTTQTCLIVDAIDMWYEANALTKHYLAIAN
jgi:hypothetical protein